ncbi:hypothetical protein ERJ75_001062800 [Trypanosoma vivax]|uniref:N-terminal domain-containing protein n=1 Tax=Trypanosoma vivax (strain Y486) TaxID=1055687 RepID=G0U0L7_TRYVY|nr:hypothetical protein TRVL_06134 [Trypanosoma vivax]KAH8610818.1 hypothetical protein ERJ75_001062800 [Trypanosoma vivax]CCC49616.1 conserved hypothetical protein [Trypanosoma vivax Y486]
MRRTPLCSATFTPAMPHLDVFLKRYADAQHPLYCHPLWLSKDDISALKGFGVGRCTLSSDRCKKVASPFPTITVEVPKTIFLFNMDQLFPESEVCWSLPLVSIPMAVNTGQPYKDSLSVLLHKKGRASGFKSNWWGTRVAWKKKGALVVPGSVPTAVEVAEITELLHISFVSNAMNILRHSYISGKTGLLKPFVRAEEKTPTHRFQCAVEEHMSRHNFLTPLYFSIPSLQRAGISVKPGSDLLDLSVTSAERGSAVDADENGICGPKNSAFTYCQYYHLSQLILQEGYRIPQSVIKAELANPGSSIHGITGEVLDIDELRRESILMSPTPELASVVYGDGNVNASIMNDEAIESTIAYLESPHNFHRRNLWYSPHDVLQMGCRVDVNAAPVEARVKGSKNSVLKFTRKLCNVEQLVSPLDGYRVVGRIDALATPMKHEDVHHRQRRAIQVPLEEPTEDDISSQ